MEEHMDSEQFSFWSHEASQGSCRNTARRPKDPKPQTPSRHKGKLSQYAHTKTSSRHERKLLAGLRSREKKKCYVRNLEASVKRLGEEVEEVERAICNCKDSLLEAIKASKSTPSEHAYTYSELERHADAEDPDLDRINLLIDLSRVGANGKQRQAQLDYNFKQIVNFMFPAMYRYLLNTATSHLDLFAPLATPSTLTADATKWTWELFEGCRLQEQQVQRLAAMQEGLAERRKEALALAVRLRAANVAIKRQGQIFERKMGDFREDMSAIQCARVLLFSEKNRLRREFAFCWQFEGVHQ